MLSTIDILLLATGALLLVGCAAAGIVSKLEKEQTALRRFLAAAFSVPVPFVLTGLLAFPGKGILGWILFGSFWGIVVLLILPIRFTLPPPDGVPTARIDERDTIFSRASLETGTARFDEYYRRHPENLEADNRFREQPGLLSSRSREADRFAFAAVEAGFMAEEHLRFITDGPVSEEPVPVDPEQITAYLRNLARYLGAHSAGFSFLREVHLYTVGGRREWYGNPVKNTHTYAIALSVEMDFQMTRQGPKPGTVMETARQYLRAAEIAVQLADFIRRLGYSARAHISSHYEVICPLVARDAGLGEIGRMGLLMTPRIGPRVRLAAVSTDLPLVVDTRSFDSTMIEFCEICRKCAAVCPSGSIPRGARSEDNGALRWRINAESCYTYWCTVGTDCGRCMAVCPYSHPDNLMHNTVRFLIKHSELFRRLAPLLDDLLYGGTPKPLKPAAWQRVPAKQSKD
ncbi:MAG: 4Fe-4S dicluster domain-containing protein [Spirochaetaceae bacterium]|nr:MAG: 4Fe-4S dicluster domain-containing protein [Spirochaetaceae bacterium]